MDIFDGTRFSALVNSNKHLFQGMLSELVKKLILNSCHEINSIRIPGKDDVWAPGFDGIVESSQTTPYVCAGLSVWEFGTNSDSLKKVNSDYDKRTNDTLGVDPQNAELNLVIPYIWAYDNQGWSKTKWESEHVSVWKKVRIFDAPMLADWINSEPAVCAWLLEQVGEEKDIDFTTVSSAWDRFSSKTSPSFSHSLFLEGREANETQLLEKLGNQIIKVKADTRVDAFGFCLSAILKRNDKANTVIVINNQITYKEISRFCKGKTFLLNFQLDCDVIEGNQVVLCYNKEDCTVQADIELRPLTKSLFDKAINDMGISTGQVADLYRKTHGNLLSLIREIPGTTSVGSPKWANQDRLDLLAPVLLLRNYDFRNECERNLVSYLAGEKYDVILEKYNTWLRLEDAPIKCIDGHIILINFEEAWNILRLSPLNPIFGRLITVINNIITPMQCTSEEAPIYIDYQSKRHSYNLFLDLIYFANVEDGKEVVEQSIKKILEITPFPALVLEHLSLLAEASPTTVMFFLQKDFKAENGIVNMSFNGTTYSQDYCEILSALDELTLHDETRVCACNYLFALCLKTRCSNFFFSKSPRESLMNALCLWNDYTAFTVEEKGSLVKQYLSSDEDYFVSFTVDLLLKNEVYFGVRKDSKEYPKAEIYTGDLYRTTNDLAGIVFKKSIESHNIENLKKLIEGYHHFCVDALMAAAELFKVNEYTAEEIIPLNFELRERLFYANKSEDMNPWLPALETWVNVTTPSDDVGRVGWMFYDYNHCYFPDVPEEYRPENRKKIENRREIILEELLQEHTDETVTHLIHFSKDDTSWGVFFARHLSSDLLFSLAKESRRLNKNLILQGLIDSANREDCIAILNSLSPEEQNMVLQNLHRRDIVDWLDTPEKEQSYWMHQMMWEYDEYVYIKLINYNPCGLLDYFAYIQKGPLTVDIDKIIYAFTEILSLPSIVPKENYSYLFDEIISKIDKEGYYSKDWAQLCAMLYDKNWLQEYPNVLKKYYFENPAILCEKALQLEYNVYSQFIFHYELPDNAYNDRSSFSSFVKAFVDKHTEEDELLSILGSILGKAHKGSDGIFPHEYVRFEMEKYRNLRLNSEVLKGKILSLNVRIIHDGTNEKEQAQQYKDDARKLDILYPESAQMLRWLSEHYAAEGIHDQLDSEIG